MQKNLGGLVNRASKKKIEFTNDYYHIITLKKYSILLIEYTVYFYVFLCTMNNEQLYFFNFNDVFIFSI